MQQPLSTIESKKRWQVILQRQDKIKASLVSTKRKPAEADATKDSSSNDDPFDCQSIIIPPIPQIIDNVLDDFAFQWQQLDFRKIGATSPSQQQEEEEEEEPATKRPKKSHAHCNWHPTHLKIPESFDYSNQREAPNANATAGIRVMSLVDPTQSSSYERALWELFQQVPTLSEIQQQVEEGMQLKHTVAINEEMKQGYENYSRIDGHALSRIRRSDRHEGMPHNNNNSSNTTTSTIATIRFECFRRQPKRGPTSDPDRAILEFLETQTLADVHRAIVELRDDEIWKLSSNSTTTTEEEEEEEQASGYFFIENQFYSIGSVDYVTPIQKWLEAGKTEDGFCARKMALGIASATPSNNSNATSLPVKSMAETRLRDIQWRLGVRYHHVHHGEVECAMFATDIHHSSAASTTSNEKAYPLVHDVWMPHQLTVDCDGCQKFPVCMATSNACAITMGHRSLCPKCSRKLLWGKSK